MASLPTDFILTLLLIATLGLHGGLRIRNEPEQLAIWAYGYKFPIRLMPMFGAAQLSASVASLLFPVLGVPAAVAMSAAEALNHTVRQSNPLVATYDLGITALAVTVGWMKGVDALFMLCGVCGGILGWLLLHSTFPLPRRDAAEKAK